MSREISLPQGGRDGTVRRLQATRFVRSVGQGALFVLFTLYMKDLGWSAAALGLLFSIGGLFTSTTDWFVGMVCDRVGRKIFLLLHETMMLLSAVVLLCVEDVRLLAAASLLLGYGRAQSGVPSGASAAEQAWLAERVPPAERGGVFSSNSALGFFGMGLGSVLAGAAPWIGQYLPGTLAYRPFFILAALGALINLSMLWSAVETYKGARFGPGASRPDAEGAGAGRAERDRADEERRTLIERIAGPNATPEEIRRKENGIMLRMALINGLNGFAIGLTGPLLVYWFNLKFGAGPGALGPVYALTYVVTGLASLWTGKLTERVGIVRAVVTVRLASVIALVLVPLMPTFTLASVVHVLRSALARGSIGARRALAVNLVRDERRGLASGINNISAQFPQALGPSIAGAFIAAGEMAMPFFIGAAMQFLYGTLYGAAFGPYDVTSREPRSKRSPGPSAA